MNKLAPLAIALAAAACTPKQAGSTLPSSGGGGAVTSTAGAAAQAGCGCLAVAGEVNASVLADVARADTLYARADFSGALALYAKAHGVSKDAVLLYAQGMTQWQLGATAEARALLQQYVSAGGSFAARAQVALRDIDAGVPASVAAGVTGAVGGVAGLGGSVAGGVGGTVGGLTAKPKRIAGTAGIVLGIVAVGAVGAVGIHAIAAGIKDDIELDAKFDLGLGLTGVVVGVTAVYVYGLTAASASVAAACATRVATLPEKKPIVAPMALNGGGGLTAVMSF